ncbi:MAG TPA: hypothetical protein DIU15_02655 [Deltaproteobacteria bacterium]|nr:hypothetical protein [Deltaproteobacteria bacterium]HCP44916.1 hypothetical protein [Deltaproteobacteria bacterium]
MSPAPDEPSFEDAEEAFERGDVETALAICEGYLGEDESKAPVEALYLAAECLLELQEVTEATHMIDLALNEHPDDAVLVHTKAICCFEQAKLEDARKGFERAANLDDQLGEPLFYLGILTERDGDFGAADRLFEHGVRLDPENLSLPVDWPADKVRQIFDEVVEEMPDPFGMWLAGLRVDVADLPDDAALAAAEGPISPLVHCLFDGPAPSPPAEKTDPDEWLTTHPSRVRLFRRNLGKSAHDEYELHREILEALLWESMEFLGLDEGHLAKLGILDDEDDEALLPGKPH